MTPSRVLRTLVIGAAAAAGYLVARGRALRWGATEVELAVGLPGDELLPEAALVATRAITVRAPAARVWPWLLQLGQDRGGFYSYDALENLAGLGIRSADRIEDRWQDLAEGDEVRLGGPVALTVARLEPERALVLTGAGPARRADDVERIAFVWSFVLRPAVLPDTCRLVVRERYADDGPGSRAAAEGVAWGSFVMTQRMLRGIRDRVEAHD